DFSSSAIEGRGSCGSLNRVTPIIAVRKPVWCRFLRTQQPPAVQKDVRQSRADLEPMQILGQASIANFLEAKHVLDDSNRVFDLGAHARLRAVLGLLRCIEPTSAPILAM